MTAARSGRVSISIVGFDLVKFSRCTWANPTDFIMDISFKTSWIAIYREFLQMEFGELRRYAASLERLLSEEGVRLTKDLDETTAKMTEEQRADFYEWASDDFHHLEKTFPRILRYSLFVHPYSVLEAALSPIPTHYHKPLTFDL